MSEVKSTQCDQCKKRVDDAYAKKGWVHISGNTSGFDIAIRGGRNKDRQSKTAGYWSGSELDFCSIECFAAFLVDLRTKKKGK